MKESYLRPHIEDVKDDISSLAEYPVTIRPCSLADYTPGTVSEKLKDAANRSTPNWRRTQLDSSLEYTFLCPDEVIEYAEFTISIEPDTFGNYNVEYEVVRSSALKYEYLLSEIGDPDEQKRFDDLAVLGMYTSAREH